MNLWNETRPREAPTCWYKKEAVECEPLFVMVVVLSCGLCYNDSEASSGVALDVSFALLLLSRFRFCFRAIFSVAFEDRIVLATNELEMNSDASIVVFEKDD